MRKLIQSSRSRGTILIALILSLHSGAAPAKTFGSPAALLSSPIDKLGLAPEAQHELNQLLGDAEGFGTRVSDLLTLDPTRISAPTREQLRGELAKFNLRPGMTKDELHDYITNSAGAAEARARLTTRAQNFLETLNIDSPDELVAQYTFVDLIEHSPGDKTLAEILAFAQLATKLLLSAPLPLVPVSEDVARGRMLGSHRRALMKLAVNNAKEFAERYSVESLRLTSTGWHYIKVLVEYAAATHHPLAVSEAERLSQKADCGGLGTTSSSKQTRESTQIRGGTSS